jgi:antitoxin component HigA of HigAB toxin-antitoxin module
MPTTQHHKWSEADYELALARIYVLMDTAAAGSPEEAELSRLADEVEAYEAEALQSS